MQRRKVDKLWKMYDSHVTRINFYSPPQEGPNMLSKVMKIKASESQGMVMLGTDLIPNII